MNAAPFYNGSSSLAFRGVPDTLAQSHVEGSECCLVHVDNPLSESQGVWVNPNVRVGYNEAAYEQVRQQAFHDWLSPCRIFVKLWEGRVRRWSTSVWFKELRVRARVAVWSSVSPERTELGGICLVNEMQVLTANGWAHV